MGCDGGTGEVPRYVTAPPFVVWHHLFSITYYYSASPDLGRPGPASLQLCQLHQRLITASPPRTSAQNPIFLPQSLLVLQPIINKQPWLRYRKRRKAKRLDRRPKVSKSRLHNAIECPSACYRPRVLSIIPGYNGCPSARFWALLLRPPTCQCVTIDSSSPVSFAIPRRFQPPLEPWKPMSN